MDLDLILDAPNGKNPCCHTAPGDLSEAKKSSDDREPPGGAPDLSTCPTTAVQFFNMVQKSTLCLFFLGCPKIAGMMIYILYGHFSWGIWGFQLFKIMGWNGQTIP